MPIRQGIRMQTKYTRKDFNAAHQVCFANLRTLRGKPRGVLTRVISAKIKKECRLHSSLALVELKAAKTHTIIYQINRKEYYCQVDLPLSDYPLYGKQLVASRG